jgi:hypothetical protein
MFTNSRSIDDRATAASFDTAHKKYAAATDSWFDGTPFSIDNRLAQCRRLMNIARTHVARRGAEVGPLHRLAELETDARALVALREDLLTGAYDREDTSPIAGVHIAAGSYGDWGGKTNDDGNPVGWDIYNELADEDDDEESQEWGKKWKRGPGGKDLEERLKRDRKGEGKEARRRIAMPAPRGTDPHFTPRTEGGEHGDIYYGDGDWFSDYGLEPDAEDRARWRELTKQRDQRLQEYIDRTGLDPYVPESQAREEKAERDRRKKVNCGDEEEFKGGEEEEVYKEAAGSLKEEHDGLAPWEAADSEKGWDKKAAGSEWRSIECPECGSKPGDNCTEGSGHWADEGRFDRTPHELRTDPDVIAEYLEEFSPENVQRGEDQRNEGLRELADAIVRGGPRKGGLSPQDRRYVTLESSRFLADNIDTNDARELGTRAMHYAQKATSSYSVDRSRTITTAFVQRVVDGATQRSNHIALLRSASRPALDRAASLPSEALFL